jgi:hypothetical protein
MCRIENRMLAERMLGVLSIAGNDGSVYAVSSVRGAYKEVTREAFVYMETERVSEEVIEAYLVSAGAGINLHGSQRELARGVAQRLQPPARPQAFSR